MEAFGVGATSIVVIVIIVLVCTCCYRICCQSRDAAETPPAPSQPNANSFNNPLATETATSALNSRYIATTDVQTGLPVVVDIASIVTQLSQTRSLPPYEGHFNSHSTDSVQYGSINYQNPILPSAPPPAYSEVDPHKH